MKPSTKDQAKGSFDNFKGKLKEVVGVITGRQKLEAEGRNQQVVGKVKKKVGQVKKVLGK